MIIAPGAFNKSFQVCKNDMDSLVIPSNNKLYVVNYVDISFFLYQR